MTGFIDSAGVRRLLPHRFPMLLIDRVESYQPEGRWVLALRRLSQADPLAGQRWQAYPPVLVIEALAQTAGLLMNLEYLKAEGRPWQGLADPRPLGIPHSVLAESRICQLGWVGPGQTLFLAARVILQRGSLSTFEVTASGVEGVVAQGSITLAYPDYTAKTSGIHSTGGHDHGNKR